jgi:hypothetical protein
MAAASRLAASAVALECADYRTSRGLSVESASLVIKIRYTSLPVLLYIETAVFWVICKFDKPNGSAHSLGPSPIPSLGDGDMLDTAWIDWPVDTQSRAPCFHVLLSAAWKHGHAQANGRLSSCVFAMAPRGFARTTRNG